MSIVVIQLGGVIGWRKHNRTRDEIFGRSTWKILRAGRSLSNRHVACSLHEFCKLLVTSVLSIQKLSTYTRWIGRESVVACIPTSFISGAF